MMLIAAVVATAGLDGFPADSLIFSQLNDVKLVPEQLLGRIR
jgi:hypothetical protein